MRLFPFLPVALFLVGVCPAQLPAPYKTVSRVTWVVENLDKVRPAWEAMGLTDIRVVHQHSVDWPVPRRAGDDLRLANHWTTRQSHRRYDPARRGPNERVHQLLSKHGDGILSIVYEVPSRQALEQEVARLKSKGVGVLQQVSMEEDGDPVQYTYFDTEPEGKFALGLVHRTARTQETSPAAVSHLGLVVWNMEAVSAYWENLGFPAFPAQHATPRDDSRYRGQPLSLAFEVGFQRHAQIRLEWISPPPDPPNIYADFLNRRRREGVQHIGVPVPDLARGSGVRETRLPRAPGGSVGGRRQAQLGPVCLHGDPHRGRSLRRAGPQLLTGDACETTGGGGVRPARERAGLRVPLSDGPGRPLRGCGKCRAAA